MLLKLTNTKTIQYKRNATIERFFIFWVLIFVIIEKRSTLDKENRKLLN